MKLSFSTRAIIISLTAFVGVSIYITLSEFSVGSLRNREKQRPDQRQVADTTHAEYVEDHHERDASLTPSSTPLNRGHASLDDLTPRQRAIHFLAVAQSDREEAAAILDSQAQWLFDEREGLAAVLFEEVIRHESSDAVTAWLDRLAGSGDLDARHSMLGYLLESALGTSGLIESPLAFLEPLTQDSRSDIARAAQLASMWHVFESGGFAAAIAQGSAFGVRASVDDTQFEALIGRALQREPQRVLTWLQHESQDQALTEFYLPFALSQWSWKDAASADNWLQSLEQSPLRDHIHGS